MINKWLNQAIRVDEKGKKSLKLRDFFEKSRNFKLLGHHKGKRICSNKKQKSRYTLQ